MAAVLAVCCVCCGPYRLLCGGEVPCGGKHIIITSAQAMHRDRESNRGARRSPPPIELQGEGEPEDTRTRRHGGFEKVGVSLVRVRVAGPYDT